MAIQWQESTHATSPQKLSSHSPAVPKTNPDVWMAATMGLLGVILGYIVGGIS